MNIEMDSSSFKTWSPKNIIVYEKNFFSRNAIVDAVKKIYPESDVFCFDCMIKTLRFIFYVNDPQHSSLVIIEFSGDKNSPLLFFNAMSLYFPADQNNILKVLIYTAVEDRFFISSMVNFISGGIVFKSESILAMKHVLYALKYDKHVVLSAKVSKLLENYTPPKLSYKELQGFLSEIGEHRLSLSCGRIDSKYKTFYSRRYSAITKMGCKNVRQYTRYLSKIVGQLSE
ncbi:hypothetical protein [Serratia fonticola]|uniref:hypothetical protein n=1 Tax=Serratia fonticola TaxID=47917 RepID=UPI0034C6B71B